MAIATWRVVVPVAAALAGCANGFEYDGLAGSPIPVRLEMWTPTVDVGIDGETTGRFLIDTGAPFTALDTDSFSDRRDGKHSVDLAAFDLVFPEYGVIAFDVLPLRMGDDPIDGVLGGDLLSHFALTIDYRDERAWLEDGWEGALPQEVSAGEVAAPIRVPADLKGAGRYVVPGDCDGDCGTMSLPATRVLVEVLVEAEAEATWALVDTGASGVVMSEPLIARLGGGDRPKLDGVTVGTATGIVTAYFTRVWSLRPLGTEGGATADVPGAPTLVLPDMGLFDAISREADRDVEVVIGGSFLREFLTAIDYAQSELVLWPYNDPSHVDPNEFIRPGFEVARGNGVWTIATVYRGTDARSKGVRSGDVLVSLDGTEVADLDRAGIDALLHGGEVGELISVELRDGGSTIALDVEVEDLLPAYEEP